VADANSRILIPTDTWRSSFLGAVVGALVMHDARNPEQNSALEAEKRRLEERLRGAGTPSVDRVAQAYVDYYRVRDKTYPVKAQRESVALKGKPIPSQAALVEAMFMAELETLILTAGHDFDAVEPPVRVDVTSDGDRYVLLNGSEAVLARGDMMMADGAGIISSVHRGLDLRTRIAPPTLPLRRLRAGGCRRGRRPGPSGTTPRERGAHDAGSADGRAHDRERALIAQGSRLLSRSRYSSMPISPRA
jgi:DNA/RNA-binding domain of Phe-tRNA-synthetase-like protein